MSFAFGEIRQERSDCYAVFYEGGPGIECRRYDRQFPSFDEAWEWVRAKHLEVMTPKVKKPVEPVYVSELDDIQHHIVVQDGGVVWPAPVSDWPVAKPAVWPSDEPNDPEVPEVAETATGDQAVSVEAPKRRGRPPKVSA